LAIVSKSLHVVIGLTSAICASFVIYILPALAFYTLLRNEHGGDLELRQYV
jgi:hypothetical protein